MAAFVREANANVDGVQVLILSRSGMDFVPCWTAKGPIATIRGIAINNDGYTKESITFPSSAAQTTLARHVRTIP